MPRSMSRVRPPSPAPISCVCLFVAVVSPVCGVRLQDVHARSLDRRARYPSGKGEVCKTFMREFDSHPRLHTLKQYKQALRERA